MHWLGTVVQLRPATGIYIAFYFSFSTKSIVVYNTLNTITTSLSNIILITPVANVMPGRGYPDKLEH